MAGLYFPSFYFSIYLFDRSKVKKGLKKLDLPGMFTVTAETQLYTKQDYKQKTGTSQEVNIDSLSLDQKN
jgi:hypothetical protein